jgi:hypothetical protein
MMMMMMMMTLQPQLDLTSFPAEASFDQNAPAAA